MHVAPGASYCPYHTHRLLSSCSGRNFQIQNMRKKKHLNEKIRANRRLRAPSVKYYEKKHTHKPLPAPSALTILTDFVTLVTLGCLPSAWECALRRWKTIMFPACVHSTPYYGNVCKVQCEQSQIYVAVNRKTKLTAPTHDTKWVDRWMSTHSSRRYRLLNQATLLNHYATRWIDRTLAAAIVVAKAKQSPEFVFVVIWPQWRIFCT